MARTWATCERQHVDCRTPRNCRAIAARGCQWCAGDETDYPDTDLLCRPHLADYEGLSVAELDRMEAEQAYDLL